MSKRKPPGLKSPNAVSAALLAMLVSVAAPAEDIRSFSDRSDLSNAVLRSGSAFLTPETQALQEDAFANPGYLWVDRGRALFKPCQSCHTESALVGAATRYPTVDRATGELFDLTARINQCREVRLELPMLPHESGDILALTAYVTLLSRGQPFDVTIDGEAARFFEAGRDYFFRRRGQLNLACNQCHDDNWGMRLRGDVISQGHPNAWPGYRLEWQGFGSLHRRLQDCDVGVRAEPFPAGSSTYRNLELYLAWRAGRLELESPGVRR